MKKILLVILILILALFGFGYYKWDKAISEFVDKYTETEGKEIKKMSLTNDALLEKRRGYADYISSLANNTAKEEYVLTGEEVNVMVKDVDEKITFTKWVYVNISDSKIFIDFSIPLNFIPMKKFEGKFFNGFVNFEGNYSYKEPNIVNVKFDEVKFAEKNVEMPNEFIKYDLNSYLSQDDEKKKAFQNIESITLEGDKLIITPKVKNATQVSENTNDTNENDDEKSLKEVLKDI